MFVAEVVGNVWGVRRHPSLRNVKLLLLKRVDPLTKAPVGEPVLGVDVGMDAGPGNTVLVMDEGNSARQMLGDPGAPIRTVVCGIIDQVFSGNRVARYA